MTHSNCSYNVNWYYHEKQCGKEPMDTLDGTVKNKFSQHVKSGNVKILNAKGFCRVCWWDSKGSRISLYGRGTKNERAKGC